MSEEAERALRDLVKWADDVLAAPADVVEARVAAIGIGPAALVVGPVWHRARLVVSRLGNKEREEGGG